MLLSEHVYCVAVTFKVTEWVEQQVRITFYVKLERSSVETIRMIQKAFGDDAMSAVQIKVWHKCFKDGRESVQSDPLSGRSATSRTPENVEHVRAAIKKDWPLTVWELEADLGDSKNYCVWDFDIGSWHEMCRGKICSAASATRAEGTSCCRC